MNIEQIMRDGVERSRADGNRWNVYGLVQKFHGADADYRARHGIGSPEEYAESFGNLLTTAGLARMTSLITGAGGTAYNAANSRIGVNDSATAAAITDTSTTFDSATNKYYKLVSGTPGASNGVMTFAAVFGTSVANFAWASWGIDNGTADSSTTGVAPLLNRKVTSLGTKTSASAWTFTVTITIA